MFCLKTQKEMSKRIVMIALFFII